MLSRRKIQLRHDSPGLPRALLTQQNLIDCGQAHAVVTRAQAMAEDLLNNAQHASDTLLEQARYDFLQKANAQLTIWQIEHKAMFEKLESCATLVVNQALQHLFDEIPQEARVAALLGQLLRAQYPPASAILRCHPKAFEVIQQWRSTQLSDLWELQTDEHLEPQALVLVTAQEDLRISWPATTEMLLLAEAEHGTDHAVPATD